MTKLPTSKFGENSSFSKPGKKVFLSFLKNSWRNNTDKFVTVVPKPTVESTFIIVAPASTLSRTLVLPGTVNTPSIKSRSLNPTNNAIL